MVGVDVGAGVNVWLGVSVQPGGRVGKFGKREHAVNAVASQNPRKMRVVFILFLYWQKRSVSTNRFGKIDWLNNFTFQKCRDKLLTVR